MLPPGLLLLAALAVMPALVPADAGAQAEVLEQEEPQARPARVSRLPAVVVYAAEQLGGAADGTVAGSGTGFATSIAASSASSGYHSVAELLEQAVGVQVRRFGGRDDFATLSVRGSTAAQVRVLIDGVPMTRAADAVLDLSSLPLDGIERIEVYRGSVPVGMSAAGAASVVNLVTRRRVKPGLATSLSIGSLDTWRVALDADRPLADGQLDASLSFRSTRGDFEFPSDNGTPLNPLDDGVERRRNNDSRALSLRTRWRQELGQRRGLEVSASAYHSEHGLPGLPPFGSLKAWRRSSRGTAGVTLDQDNGSLALDLLLEDNTLADPRAPGEPGLGLGYSKGDDRSWRVGLRGNHRLAFGAHLAELSFEGAFEDFSERRAISSGTLRSTAQRSSLALAVGDELLIENAGLLFAPQLRFESLWNDFASSAGGTSKRASSLDPGLGLSWNATPTLLLKGNIGSYFRAPDFSELFGNTGFSLASPDLEPESGLNRDLGFSWQRAWHRARPGVQSSARLEYAWFNNDSDNRIVFIQTGTRQTRAINIGSARVRGHELSATARLGRIPFTGQAGGSLLLEANLTSQDARNLSGQPSESGRRLPGIPDRELFGRATWQRGPASIAWHYQYRDTVYYDKANVFSSGSSARHGLELAWRASDDWKFTLQLDNLSDEQTPDVFGFPVPGRALFLGLSTSRDNEN